MRWTAFSAILFSAGCGASGAEQSLPDSAPGDDAAVEQCTFNTCFPEVLCSETSAGPACGDCPPGYTGDGTFCTDTDGCSSNNCFDGVVCIDNPAPDDGFECGTCPPGSEGDGVACTEIDGCAGEPCGVGVDCTDIPAPGVGYVCGDCPPGTSGDGESCTEIDGCEFDNCFPSVSCTDVPAPGDGFVCGPCPSGYSGDGATCTLMCEATAAIGCGSSVAATTTGLGSKDEVDTWDCAAAPLTGREIVYAFTAPSDGIAAASLSGLSDDLDLLVLKDVGGICNPLDTLACVPGGYSGTEGTVSEFVRWDATMGQTYYVVVDGFDGAVSGFTLQVGTALGDVLLHEISSDTVDFVELRNHGACDVNLGNFSLYHGPSCQAPFDFTFPGVLLAPLGVFRAVETGVVLEPNETSFGTTVCDFSDDIGFTALCAGPCDTASCTNVLDYVERDGNLGDAFAPAGPSCVSFSPGPVDVSSLNIGDEFSVRRAAFSGVPLLFERGDWGLGPTTFD